jgi:DNA-directed RNA polymerase specialized sigma subunit
MKRTKFNTVPEQHLLLIRKIAHTSHTIYGWDEEDLFSEACLAYCLARDKYDAKKKAKKSSFLWRSIQWHLQEYLRKQSRVICTLTSFMPTIPDNSMEVFTDNIQLDSDNSSISSII